MAEPMRQPRQHDGSVGRRAVVLLPHSPHEPSHRRRLVGVFFCLLAAAVAVACGKRSESNRHYLTYWSSNNQDEINFAAEVVKEWNALHPEMPVRHQPVPEGESSEEVVLAAVVGKTTPDVYSNMWPGEVELYARARALVPLDQFADFDSVASSRFDPDKVQEARSLDGHIYQFPWKTNPVMMMYNAGLFAELGITRPPVTYSEYIRVAARVTADTDGDGYVDRWMALRDIRGLWRERLFDFYPLYIAASGGQMLLRRGRVNFNNRSAVQVFAFLRTMYERGYYPLQKALARGDFFLQGKVATRFTGPWEIAHTEKYKPAGFRYDFAPLPVPDDYKGPVYTYGDYKNIVIFSTTPQPRAAWEFVKFITSRRNDLLLLTITNQLPLRRKLFADDAYRRYFEEHPMMSRFARQSTFVRGVDAAPVMKEIFDAIAQEYEACVVFGVKSPEQAVADAAARAALILQ